jgi:hypothetical protein
LVHIIFVALVAVYVAVPTVRGQRLSKQSTEYGPLPVSNDVNKLNATTDKHLATVTLLRFVSTWIIHIQYW